jgi:hypothetical protein
LQSKHEEIDWVSNCAAQVISVRLKIVQTSIMVEKEILKRGDAIVTLVSEVVKYKGSLGVLIGQLVIFVYC